MYFICLSVFVCFLPFHLSHRCVASPKDGVISEAEARKDLTDFWDVNGDGTINERECVRNTVRELEHI